MEACGKLYIVEFSFPYSEVLRRVAYIVQGYILDISNGSFQILIWIVLEEKLFPSSVSHLSWQNF